MILLAAFPAAAPLPPAQPGKCGWVHGRFAVYNGSSVRRIWIIGTSRIVAMRDNDQASPSAVDRYVRSGPYTSFGDALFGDFRICAPEARRPGHMQHVGIIAARKLIFRGRRFDRSASPPVGPAAIRN